MTVVVTPEQRELRTVAKGFFSVYPRTPAHGTGTTKPPAHDTATWRRLSDELGVQAMRLPEELGGGGFSSVDLGLVLQESGASLYDGPLLSTALAVEGLLAVAEAPGAGPLLERLGSAASVATVGLLEAPGHWGRPAARTFVEGSGDSCTLTGRVMHVLDGGTAEFALVSARSGELAALVAVETCAAGVTVEELATLDQTRRQAHLTFSGAPAQLLASGEAAERALARLRAAAAIYLAAEQLGGADRVLALTVDYTKTRHQYGRPIGSFQALKHLCADLAATLEAARTAVYVGLEALDTDAPDLALSASAAKVFCSDAYDAAAAACIQLHGAIGTTWEHVAHLYYKRARSSGALFGTAARHRELLAEALGLMTEGSARR